MQAPALQRSLAAQIQPSRSKLAKQQPAARRAAPQLRRAPRCDAGQTEAAASTAAEPPPTPRLIARRPASPEDDDVFDLVATARRKSSRPFPAPEAQRPASPVQEFLGKCVAAYRIFFPPRRDLSPKELGRNRLRMILVADRCAMNPSSLTDMKTSIVAAVSNYVEVEAEEEVEVSITTDDDLGTIYSVAVPVKRVKATARVGLQEDVQGLVEAEWDEDDPDADPSSRFPFGC